MEIRKFPDWYRKYRWAGRQHRLSGYPADEYPDFKWITSLEMRFRLYREDPDSDPAPLIEEMIQWGGNQHGILRRFNGALGYYCLKDQAREVLNGMQSPAAAMDAALAIRGLGVTYASKLLRFLEPENFGALDSRLRKALTPSVLPKIYDGYKRSGVAGYCAFISYLDALKRELQINRIDRPCESGGNYAGGLQTSRWHYFSGLLALTVPGKGASSDQYIWVTAPMSKAIFTRSLPPQSARSRMPRSHRRL